jgi:hypothetical protein
VAGVGAGPTRDPGKHSSSLFCSGRNKKKATPALCEWNHLVVVAKQYPPFPKSTLVILTSEQLLKVLGLNAWGVSSVPRDVTSRMEKDEYLQRMI